MDPVILRSMLGDVVALQPNFGRALAVGLAEGADPATVLEMFGFGKPPELSVRDAYRQSQGQSAGRRAVVTIPIFGLMLQHSSLWGTSTAEAANLIRQQANRGDLAAIVLNIHSPGGSVYGVRELAVAVYEARKRVPVFAVANSMAASAAYWVASQATILAVTPGGEVGSIGVYSMHQDISKAAEQMGIKVTLLAVPRKKVAGNPYEPLDDGTAAELLAKNQEVYGWFVADVARGRGVSVSKVGNGFGQGGMLFARRAIAEGMADRAVSLHNLLAELTKATRMADGRTAAQYPGLAGRLGSADKLPTDVDYWRSQARIEAAKQALLDGE